MCLKHDAQVFIMRASLKLERETLISNLPVVSDFPDVSLDYISDFPPEHEFEFVIDLVLGTIPVSMAPYRMSA